MIILEAYLKVYCFSCSVCNGYIYPLKTCYTDSDCTRFVPNSECTIFNNDSPQRPIGPFGNYPSFGSNYGTSRLCRCNCDLIWNGYSCVPHDLNCWYSGLGLKCDSPLMAILVIILIAILITCLFVVFTCVVVTCFKSRNSK